MEEDSITFGLGLSALRGFGLQELPGLVVDDRGLSATFMGSCRVSKGSALSVATSQRRSVSIILSGSKTTL